MEREMSRNGDPVPARPDREGMRFVTALADEVTHKEVRAWAAREATTVDGLVTAAVAEYLKKHRCRVSKELSTKLQTLDIG